jgi:hypothetical protein
MVGTVENRDVKEVSSPITTGEFASDHHEPPAQPGTVNAGRPRGRTSYRRTRTCSGADHDGVQQDYEADTELAADGSPTAPHRFTSSGGSGPS